MTQGKGKEIVDECRSLRLEDFFSTVACMGMRKTGNTTMAFCDGGTTERRKSLVGVGRKRWR